MAVTDRSRDRPASQGAPRWSRGTIDRLGERLRRPLDDDSITDLDQYRRTFWPAYRAVGDALHGKLARQEIGASAELSGRFGKSTYATVAKLKRMSIRLSQMQDIAGYRIVLSSARAADDLLAELQSLYPHARRFDRRDSSSHGYRAVHLVVNSGGWPIEIQVRTVFQHLWAQLSERLADVLAAPGIKYGEYPTEYPETETILAGVSAAVARFEEYEKDPGATSKRLAVRKNSLLKKFEQALQVLED